MPARGQGEAGGAGFDNLDPAVLVEEEDEFADDSDEDALDEEEEDDLDDDII